MNKILTPNEINQFKTDGAILLKDKFDISWIKKLQKGIERDIKNPSTIFKTCILDLIIQKSCRLSKFVHRIIYWIVLFD